jgi:hypothetical protein
MFYLLYTDVITHSFAPRICKAKEKKKGTQLVSGNNSCMSKYNNLNNDQQATDWHNVSFNGERVKHCGCNVAQNWIAIQRIIPIQSSLKLQTQKSCLTSSFHFKKILWLNYRLKYLFDKQQCSAL